MFVIRCDNYKDCKGEQLGDDNRARAAGWGIWQGEIQGTMVRLSLCPKCRKGRLREKLPKQLPGQLELPFEEDG